jgi:calcineurin-like phosphoesterase family protein
VTIFVVGDTHFGHENILKFTNFDGTKVRSFSCVEEMDETMVNNWNKVVTDSDIVYHLGDVFFGKGHQHLSRLKGRKRLILGNHDNAKSEHLNKTFQKILMWRMFPEFNALLSHVPVHKSVLYKTKYNIHGHVHGNSLDDRDYINCSVEAIDYIPQPLELMIKNTGV